MENYTKTAAGEQRLPDRVFVSWSWIQLAIVLLIAIKFAEWIRSLPNFNIAIGLVASLPVIFVAWRVAKTDDSAFTSFLAVLVGAAGYGVIAGGYTEFAATPDLIRVFTISGCFVALCGIMESASPGFLARLPWASVFPMVFAPFLYLVFTGHQSLSPVKISEILVYVFITAAAFFKYRSVWAAPHTLDNAIDFSLEFMLDFWEVFPKWKWGQHE